MPERVTVFAPFKLAAGKTEADLIKASNEFQRDFVDAEPGIIRRELINKGNGEYLDIVQFRSREDALAVMEKEKVSPACHVFFSVMDMSGNDAECIDMYQSLRTYGSNI
jgi:hypothetical protein